MYIITNNMKQTAIDWFIENLPNRFKNAMLNECGEEIKKAKAMEQQKEMLIEIMNEDAKDGLYDNKPFTTGSLRKITDACEMGYISYGRMVEMINEIAIKWHNKNK